MTILHHGRQFPCRHVTCFCFPPVRRYCGFRAMPERSLICCSGYEWPVTRVYWATFLDAKLGIRRQICQLVVASVLAYYFRHDQR